MTFDIILRSLLLLSLHLAVQGFKLNVANVRTLKPCEQAVRRATAIENLTVVIDSPDNIHGKWVSEGCETRAGPEFLLRSYTFHQNNSFRLVQHYYGDESCSTPMYTAIARGRLREGHQYSLTRVGIVPHNYEVAQQMAAKLFATCPGIPRKRWKQYKEHLIFNFPEDTSTSLRPFATSTSHQDIPLKTISYSGGNKKGYKTGHSGSYNCLQSISLVFHELQHYKVQIRPGTDDDFNVSHLRQELLLGDIHSRVEGRASYKPTAYQVPLLKVDNLEDILGLENDSLIQSDSLLNIDPKGVENTRGHVREKSYVGHFDVGRVGDLDSIISSKTIKEETTERQGKVKDPDIFYHCPVCSTVNSASEKSPPYFMTKTTLPIHLGGEWVSLHCEVKPMGLYLMRHFRFYTGDNTWIVEYKFYLDSKCSGPSFSVTAAGHFKKGKPNHKLPRGTEFNFHIKRASLTVFDPHMMYNLEKDPNCGVGPWKLGVPREMSSTLGCTTLGLVVPSVEYELLKLEVDFHGSPLLYMGQADTDNMRRDAKDRPTAYQPALVQCQELPLYSKSLREILRSPLYSEDMYSNYDTPVLEMDSSDSRSFNFSSKTMIVLFNLALFLYYL